MKVIPTVKEGEKANSKPSYIQKKNKTQGLKKQQKLSSQTLSQAVSHTKDIISQDKMQKKESLKQQQ